MKPFPTLLRADIPVLTTKQMIEVDRAMIDEYHIELIQMMENAGRLLAMVARDRFFNGKAQGHNVTVLAGRGGNGGGAMVAARRLATWGCTVRVALTRPLENFAGVPLHQLQILQAMGIPAACEIPQSGEVGLILDGLIGYSLAGPPHGMAADLIHWANAQSAAVLALDTPSGLDNESGQALMPSIKAAATLTLALPKTGLSHPCTGELYLGDISVPPALYERFLGIAIGAIFAEGDIAALA